MFSLLVKPCVHTIYLNWLFYFACFIFRYACRLTLVWFFARLHPELPVEILTPLRETVATEHETVSLEAELSKPNEVVLWFKDGRPIPETDYRFEPWCEGTKQGLMIFDLDLGDEADYTLIIGDRSTTATVFVKGMYLMHSLMLG